MDIGAQWVTVARIRGAYAAVVCVPLASRGKPVTKTVTREVRQRQTLRTIKLPRFVRAYLVSVGKPKDVTEAEVDALSDQQLHFDDKCKVYSIAALTCHDQANEIRAIVDAPSDSDNNLYTMLCYIWSFGLPEKPTVHKAYSYMTKLEDSVTENWASRTSEEDPTAKAEYTAFEEFETSKPSTRT